MDLLLSEVPGSINRRRLNSADQVKFPLLIVNDEKKILIRPIAVLSLKLSLWQCGSRDFNFSLTELARHLRCHDVAGSQISSLNYSRPRSFRSHVKGRSPAIHIQTVITENIVYQAVDRWWVIVRWKITFNSLLSFLFPAEEKMNLTLEYCPPNVTLDVFWVNHGLTRCFLDTVSTSIITGFLVLFGTIESLIYRKYGSPIQPRPWHRLVKMKERSIFWIKLLIFQFKK